jgi:hypothetical protein
MKNFEKRLGIGFPRLAGGLSSIHAAPCRQGSRVLSDPKLSHEFLSWDQVQRRFAMETD